LSSELNENELLVSKIAQMRKNRMEKKKKRVKMLGLQVIIEFINYTLQVSV